jgi:NAD(P)-dependent dehydrogenase (short-subunit alcohol dehydrogenase family)
LARRKLVNTTLITGANRGLGLEFARQYAADGWHVLAACRNPDDADALQRLAREAPGRFGILKIDVTDAGSIRRAVAPLTQSIDLLLNSAGIMGARGQATGRVDYEDWARVLDVNAMGPMRMVEGLVDQVAQSSRRLIVTITSGMGSLADNTSGGYIPYRTSKAAVNMAMRSAAVDLARRHVTCVLLNPGWVKTDMGGAGAKLTPQQSVTAMRGLIERLGPADTGKFYNYDGGEYAW